MPNPLPRSKKAKDWLIYLILVAAALVAHACAVDLDSQSERTAAVPARHA